MSQSLHHLLRIVEEDAFGQDKLVDFTLQRDPYLFLIR